MRSTMGGEAHPAQRGFVYDRQLTKNVVEMDAYARLFKTTVPDTDCPVLVLLDHLAAFPSVCQLFMFSALAFLGFPDGLINLIAALYADGALLWQGPGAEEVCRNTSGVAQGCPSSGMLASRTRSCDGATRFCAESAHRHGPRLRR